MVDSRKPLSQYVAITYDIKCGRDSFLVLMQEKAYFLKNQHIRGLILTPLGPSKLVQIIDNFSLDIKLYIIVGRLCK